MSNLTYTPGPWIADGIFVGTRNSMDFFITCHSGNGEANARLISAAPDLLALARATVAGLDTDMDAQRLKARLALPLLYAIQKAEGMRN